MATFCTVVLAATAIGHAGEIPPIPLVAPSCSQRDHVLVATFGPKPKQPDVYSLVFVVSDASGKSQFTEIVPVDTTSGVAPLGIGVEPMQMAGSLTPASRIECYVTPLLGSKRSTEYTAGCSQGHSDLGLDAKVNAIEVTPSEAYVNVTVRYAETGFMSVRYLNGEPLLIRDSASGEVSRTLVYGPTPATAIVGVGIQGARDERLEVGTGDVQSLPESTICL